MLTLEDAYDYAEFDHDYLPDQFSEFTKNIIVYVAGYVDKKKIICETCSDALTDDHCNNISIYSFVDEKNKKCLQKSSTDVIDICFKTKKIINHLSYEVNKMYLDVLTNTVLKQFIHKNSIFISLKNHSYDQFPLDNHRVLLIKSVANRYANVLFE